MYVVTARFSTGALYRIEVATWQEALALSMRWRKAGADTKVRAWTNLAEADRAE